MPDPRISKLPDVSNRPRMPEAGWTIYDSQWQVEKVDESGRVVEKIAYTNFFFAAHAAYEAALVALPDERVQFRQRARIIRKSWEG